MVKSPILDNIFEEICFGVTFFFFESNHGEFWLQLIILIKSLYFFRSNFSSNNLNEAEAKKAAALLAVEDLRVAVVRGNTAAVQKYLDNGEMQLWLISVVVVKNISSL